MIATRHQFRCPSHVTFENLSLSLSLSLTYSDDASADLATVGHSSRSPPSVLCTVILNTCLPFICRPTILMPATFCWHGFQSNQIIVVIFLLTFDFIFWLFSI